MAAYQSADVPFRKNRFTTRCWPSVVQHACFQSSVSDGISNALPARRRDIDDPQSFIANPVAADGDPPPVGRDCGVAIAHLAVTERFLRSCHVTAAGRKRDTGEVQRLFDHGGEQMHSIDRDRQVAEVAGAHPDHRRTDDDRCRGGLLHLRRLDSRAAGGFMIDVVDSPARRIPDMAAPLHKFRRPAPGRRHGVQPSFSGFECDPARVRRVVEANDFPVRRRRGQNRIRRSAIDRYGNDRAVILLSGHVEDRSAARMPDGEISVFCEAACLPSECRRYPHVATERTRIESNDYANLDEPGA